MIRHLFILIWNRRRTNILLIVEIFLAFIVLFAVGSVVLYMRQNYEVPLGFQYEQVWRIELNSGTQSESQQFSTFQQVLLRLKATSGIEQIVRTSANTPFSFNNATTKLEAGSPTQPSRVPIADLYHAGPELRDVLSLQLTAGRWFDQRDDATTRPAVVITDATRAALFPGQSPLGKIIRSRQGEWQVVGVINSYRAGGELSVPRPGILLYVSSQDTAQAPLTLLVRVHAGAGAALGKQISEGIRAVAPTWTSSIVPLSEERLMKLKLLLAMPVMLGIVCLFLTLNVALGIFGVLWLNISQRRVEIGLRRAIGASAGSISNQVVGEILVITTFSLLLGLFVTVQFPLLGVFNVPASVYGLAILLAGGIIYGLAVVCALYPSWLAADIHPAVALREE